MNRTNEQTRRGEASDRNTKTNALACPACGAAVRRESAHFCATCGRGLKDNFYAPADSLLASYHLQHTRQGVLFEREMEGTGRAAERTTKPHVSLRIFAHEGNTAAAIALIMVFSALVPFIGILFCPFAILIGGFGLLEARFVPDTGGSRLAVCCIVFGFLIAGAQVLLWSYI